MPPLVLYLTREVWSTLVAADNARGYTLTGRIVAKEDGSAESAYLADAAVAVGDRVTGSSAVVVAQAPSGLASIRVCHPTAGPAASVTAPICVRWDGDAAVGGESRITAASLTFCVLLPLLAVSALAWLAHACGVPETARALAHRFLLQLVSSVMLFSSPLVEMSALCLAAVVVCVHAATLTRAIIVAAVAVSRATRAQLGPAVAALPLTADPVAALPAGGWARACASRSLVAALLARRWWALAHERPRAVSTLARRRVLVDAVLGATVAVCLFSAAAAAPALLDAVIAAAEAVAAWGSVATVRAAIAAVAHQGALTALSLTPLGAAAADALGFVGAEPAAAVVVQQGAAASRLALMLHSAAMAALAAIEAAGHWGVASLGSTLDMAPADAAELAVAAAFAVALAVPVAGGLSVGVALCHDAFALATLAVPALVSLWACVWRLAMHAVVALFRLFVGAPVRLVPAWLHIDDDDARKPAAGIPYDSEQYLAATFLFTVVAFAAPSVVLYGPPLLALYVAVRAVKAGLAALAWTLALLPLEDPCSVTRRNTPQLVPFAESGGVVVYALTRATPATVMAQDVFASQIKPAVVPWM